MPTVVIRAFQKADLPAILRMERECFGQDAWPREMFLDYAAEAPELFLVARVPRGVSGSSIAGYSIARMTRHEAEIASLAVRPLFRRRGVATALLRASLRKLRRSGAKAVWLMVRSNNQEAIGLYRRLGFLRTATVPNYYDDRSSGWRMGMGLDHFEAAVRA